MVTGYKVHVSGSQVQNNRTTWHSTNCGAVKCIVLVNHVGLTIAKHTQDPWQVRFHHAGKPVEIATTSTDLVCMDRKVDTVA
jgi:hypothetical protein